MSCFIITKKLFWEDPYCTECKAKVTSIEGNKVKLDQTVFFACSGGQESDSGTIGGINVVAAIKQGDKENIIDIEYELEKEPNFKVGDEVEVKIDEENRLEARGHFAKPFAGNERGPCRYTLPSFFGRIVMVPGRARRL